MMQSNIAVLTPPAREVKPLPTRSLEELKHLRDEAERDILAILSSLTNLTACDLRGVEVCTHMTIGDHGSQERPLFVRIDLCL